MINWCVPKNEWWEKEWCENSAFFRRFNWCLLWQQWNVRCYNFLIPLEIFLNILFLCRKILTCGDDAEIRVFDENTGSNTSYDIQGTRGFAIVSRVRRCRLTTSLAFNLSVYEAFCISPGISLFYWIGWPQCALIYAKRRRIWIPNRIIWIGSHLYHHKFWWYEPANSFYRFIANYIFSRDIASCGKWR